MNAEKRTVKRKGKKTDTMGSKNRSFGQSGYRSRNFPHAKRSTVGANAAEHILGKEIVSGFTVIRWF